MDTEWRWRPWLTRLCAVPWAWASMWAVAYWSTAGLMTYLADPPLDITAAGATVRDLPAHPDTILAVWLTLGMSALAGVAAWGLVRLAEGSRSLALFPVAAGGAAALALTCVTATISVFVDRAPSAASAASGVSAVELLCAAAMIVVPAAVGGFVISRLTQPRAEAPAGPSTPAAS